MPNAPRSPRRMALPILLLLFLCVAVVLFVVSRVLRTPTAQIVTEEPGVKLMVVQKPLTGGDTAVVNQKDVNLLRFEARAEQPSGVFLSGLRFTGTTPGMLANAERYTLWADTNGDRQVDTLVKNGTMEGDSVVFAPDALLPGPEQCETSAQCPQGQTCSGCRCTTPGTPLQGQLVTPNYVGRLCSDSDGGKNSAQRGTTTNVRIGSLTVKSWQDTCLKDWTARPADLPADPMKLLEGYCPSPSSYYGAITYPQMTTCPLGCDNGACVEALLRSIALEGKIVRVSYLKSFEGCAQLRDEKNRILQNGQFFCNKDETVGYHQVYFRLSEGLKVKLCRTNGQGCSALVTVTRTPVCGDGLLQPPEQCDDGNLIQGDGCSNRCQVQGNGTACISPSDCPSSFVCSTVYGECDPVSCPKDVPCPDVCTGKCVPPRSSSSSAGCTDSDGGKIYGVKGTTVGVSPSTGQVYEGTDVCGKAESPYAKKGELVEHFCDGPLHTNEIVPCPYGCLDGACLREQAVCGNSRLETPEQCDIGSPCPGGRICEIGTCLCRPAQCTSSSSSWWSSASSRSIGSSSSSAACAGEGQKVYVSAQFGPTTCCSKNAGIKPNGRLAPNGACMTTTDGSLGTCVENWWRTCGDGTCGADEDLCSCPRDCTPVCGNRVVESGEQCDGGGCGTGTTCVNCKCQQTGSCGNGFVDMAPTIVYEVHADIAQSPLTNELQLRFASVEGENALTGRDLVGLSTNGACSVNQSCEIALTTVDSTVWTLQKQGDLFVTLDSTPVRSHQLLAGALNETVLRLKFHAEVEDISVVTLVLHSSGSLASSVNALHLFKEGGSAPIAFGSACTTVPHAFCFSMQSDQLVVGKGQDVKLLVRPLLKSDVEGAVSGGTIAFFIDPSDATVVSTQAGAVQAIGKSSSNLLAFNDGDSTAEGEIFIGRPTPSGANVSVAGPSHVTVLSKLISIVNGGAVTGGMPTGSDREIGAFTLNASSNTNTKNGLNAVELTDVVFSVNAYNVLMQADGFKVMNKASGPNVVERCSPFSLQGTALTDTVTGVFLVHCSLPSTSTVNSRVESGQSLTLVLLANVVNPNTAASTGGASTLQVMLNNFSDPWRKEFGVLPGKSFFQWKDRDFVSATTFTWVESPDSAVISTLYNG